MSTSTPSSRSSRLPFRRFPRQPDASSAPADERVRRALDEADLVAETRRRLRSSRTARDRWSSRLLGGSFALVMTGWVLLAHVPFQPVLLVCVVAHVLASSVEFEIGPGIALTTTPVLVVELFLLPPAVVPLAVCLGLLGAAALARLRDPTRREPLLVLAANAWHAVGPAAVVSVLGLRTGLATVAVVALAVAAQLVLDLVTAWLRNCVGLGVPTSALLGALRFTFAVDVLLAPIGLAAALAAPGSAWALVFLVGPVVLLGLLQRDRRRQIDQSQALNAAAMEQSRRARSDALTGLANRLAWEEALVELDRGTEPVGVVLADVDGLKPANDTYGHEMGDQLIVATAQLLSRFAPEGSVVARLGGDEFGVLLPGTDADTPGRLAAALRAAMQSAPLLEGRVAVSASLGSSWASAGPGLGAAIGEADRGVYDDKRRRKVGRRTDDVISPAPSHLDPHR